MGRVARLRSPRRAARALAAACAALVVVAAAAPSAFGHAAFLESSPAPGTRLESSPDRIELEFTEPLNRKLTTVVLADARSGERVATALGPGERNRYVLRPQRELERAAYRVEWHTVSTLDGHALEGSFGFGVRTAAVGGEQRLEQSPLARSGWLRILVRGGFYALLFVFAGGVLVAALISPRGDPAGWLVPQTVRSELERTGDDPEAAARRTWARTVDAGWLAAAAAVAVALLEASDAARGLSPRGAADFLLSNVAGLARVLTALALVAAAGLAARRPRAAAAAVALTFLAIAVSGHANSAEPRGWALLTDWAHLVAAAVWVGGIAQIALAWRPSLGTAGRGLRRALMREVLGRFGRVALPAFLLVAATGLVNALIQLGRPEALWETAYGRVLAVKIGLVGLIALASYLHALRLRPRVLAMNPHPPARLERRHWRLLRSEPAVAVGVVVAAAALAVFPLPPRQLAESGEAAAAPRACDPCPLPRPAAGELAVAEQAGSRIAAVWLRRAGAGVRGTLRLLDSDLQPVDREVRVRGAAQRSCGPGCWRFRLAGRPARIEASVEERGKVHVARIPARWRPRESRRARRLLERAQRAMRALRSVRERETVTSGPGTFVVTRYALRAPDRFAYVTSSGAESRVAGTRQWSRSGSLPWQRGRFGGGGPGFRTRSWFRWTPYAQSAQLLGIRAGGGRRLARVALMDHGTPVWFRLTIDLRTMRVLRVRMIARAHFMRQRFFDFDEPVRIEPPAGRGDGA